MNHAELLDGGTNEPAGPAQGPDGSCHEAAPGTLAVRMNLPRLDWPWGRTMPAVDRHRYDTARIRLRVEVTSQLAGAAPGGSRRGSLGGSLGGPQDGSPGSAPAGSSAEEVAFHRFSGVPGAHRIRMERTVPGIGPLRLEISNLFGDEILVRANRRYAALVRYRMMGLHSLGYVLGDLVESRMLHDGLVPLYGAAIRHPRWGVVLLVGASTAGKSLTALRLCREQGAELIAEDRVILDGSGLVAVPWTTSHVRGLGVRWARPATVPTVAGDVEAVDHLVLLERGGGGSRQQLPAGEAERRVGLVSRTVSAYPGSPALLAYSYLNPDLDLEALIAVERQGWHSLVRGVSSIHVLRGADPRDFASGLASVLGGPS